MVFTKMRTMSLKLLRSRDQCLFCRMVLNMRESGTQPLIKDMVEATKFGLTEASMKDTGKMTKQMVEVDLSMLRRYL